MFRPSLLLLVTLSGISWGHPLTPPTPTLQNNKSLKGAQNPPTLVEQQRAKLIAEAESKGYVIEYIGPVSERKDVCALIKFDFKQWLSDEYYKTEATRVLNESGVKQEEIPAMVYNLTSAFLDQAISKFDKFTADLDEFKVGPFETVLTVEVTARRRDHRNTGALTSSLLNDLDTVAWVFRDTLKENLKYVPIYSEDLYSELAQRILGRRYKGSFFEDYGVNSAEHMSSMTLRGTAGFSSVIAEVCMATSHKDEAFDGFVIRPKGNLTGDTYEHVVMNEKYVQDPRKPGFENLLEADFTVNKAGIYVASEFVHQRTSGLFSKHCALKTPGHCPIKSQSLDENNGTILISLVRDALVITSKKLYQCADENGVKRPVVIETPIFVYRQECWDFRFV